MCSDCRSTLLPLHALIVVTIRRHLCLLRCSTQLACSFTRTVSFIERSHCYTGQPVCTRTLCRIERGRYAFSVPGYIFHQRAALPFGLQQQALCYMFVHAAHPRHCSAAHRQAVRQRTGDFVPHHVASNAMDRRACGSCLPPGLTVSTAWLAAHIAPINWITAAQWDAS